MYKFSTDSTFSMKNSRFQEGQYYQSSQKLARSQPNAYKPNRLRGGGVSVWERESEGECGKGECDEITDGRV